MVSYCWIMIGIKMTEINKSLRFVMVWQTILCIAIVFPTMFYLADNLNINWFIDGMIMTIVTIGIVYGVATLLLKIAGDKK
jgi:hypothetical protein